MATPWSEVDSHDSRQIAIEMGRLGYKIVPLPAGEKFPKGLREWQKRATADEAQIEKWFSKPGLGIGWAMGQQPNGLMLAGIDVDVANGKQGWASLRELDVRFNLRSMIKNTVTSVTGSDGRHLIVNTGSTATTNGILGPGLDLRGEGGFLVAPPSVHPNGQPYRWIDGKSPWEIEPFAVEPEFAEFLAAPHEPEPIVPSAPALPVGVRSDEDSPADWVRENFQIQHLLLEAGWQYSHNQGPDQFWTRPDKAVRDGHSGVIHEEGPLVVWSTSAPAPFWRAGKPARDGSRVLSPFEVLAAVRYQGDTKAAAREVRKLMPKAERVTSILDSIPRELTGGSAPEGRSEPGGLTSGALNLADEFWEARPILTQIRQAAHNRLVSPDATLLGVLARYSALVPPSLRLPPLVGAEATFDFIGCSVATSSGGKTVANSVAAELVPNQRKDITMDLSPGSGEGLIQSFMVPEVDPESGKPTGKQVVGMQAIHFTVDEGTALMEQQARKGTTIVQTLCSAWSGAPLGQANASAETRRIIEARRVRVSAVINIQTSNGHLLLDDRMIAVGLPQRIVFASAHSPLPPLDQLPDWPGALDLPVPPSITGSTATIEVAPEIAQEVREARYAVATGAVTLGAIDGHLGLSRMKIAGLLALMDDRRQILPSDWHLAEMIVDSSKQVRSILISVKQESDRGQLNAQGVASATRELAAEDYKERQKIAALSDRLVTKVPSDGLGKNALRKLLCSSDTKHRFEPALEQAITRGAVRVEDGTVHLT